MARRSSTARRYAEAAFEVAMRDGTLERWRAELDLAADVIGDRRIVATLANPAIAGEKRAATLGEMLGGHVSGPVLNLVQLMLRRGRIEDLPRVASEFRRLDDQRQGIVHASVTSAAELTQDEVKELTARLEQTTGGRISLEVEVDPSLLGGLVVRVGDRMIDGSVRGRLERLRNQLLAGAL
jgi:F-type H+-transporting ATPase subunit delta